MRAVNNKINWDNAEYVNEQFRASGYVLREFARRMGVSSSTAHYGLKKVEERGLLEKPVAPPRHRRDIDLKKQEAQAEEDPPAERELAEEVYAFLKKAYNRQGATVESLSDALDVSPRRIREAVGELEDQGKHIMRSGDVVSAHIMAGIEERATVEVEPSETICVGVVSDTHYGSRHEQPSATRAFMEDAAERYPLSCWLHVGDLTDGVPNVYKGHLHELWTTRVDEQVEYAADVYPDTGVPTYIIGGNHDEQGIKTAGNDPIKTFASLRGDVTALGWRGAYVDVGGVSFYLYHGTGGLSYARSYKLQKRVDAFSDTDKPHILLCGHWHSFAWVWQRNVQAFLVPSFQGTTTYIKALGYESLVGGLVLELGLDDFGEPIMVTPHLTKFSPVAKDYPTWR